eukprot:scaffold288010_cov26-Tisochrysis_lutea.AAC.1
MRHDGPIRADGDGTGRRDRGDADIRHVPPESKHLVAMEDEIAVLVELPERADRILDIVTAEVRKWTALVHGGGQVGEGLGLVFAGSHVIDAASALVLARVPAVCDRPPAGE